MLGEAGLVAADDVGRERHYRLERSGLAPVADYLTGLESKPRFDESVLDGLDLEVRRTVRERSTEHATDSTTQTTNEETA